MRVVLFFELEDAVGHFEDDVVVGRSAILFLVKLGERLGDCLFHQDAEPTYKAAKFFLCQIQTQDLLVALMPENQNNKELEREFTLLGDDFRCKITPGHWHPPRYDRKALVSLP